MFEIKHHRLVTDKIQNIIETANEAPRRKRTGYQSGLKTNLDYGGHVVSPKPPSAYFTPPQADGVLENYNRVLSTS